MSDELIPGLARPWKWTQPANDQELLERLAQARDYRVCERERENLCSVAHGRLAALLSDRCSVCGRGPHACDDPECKRSGS